MAQKHGFAPCAFVLHQPKETPWTFLDYELAEAQHTLEKETCQRCGEPLWICRTTDPNVYYAVETAVCEGEKALELWQSKQEKNKKKEQPGQYPFARAKLYDRTRGYPLREDWVKDEVETLKELGEIDE